MTKTANILKKVFSVLFWVVIVIGVVLFVSLLAMLLFREAWLTDKLIHIDLGSFSFKLNLYYTADQVRALVSLLLVQIVFYVSVLCMVFCYLHNILDSVANGKPFDRIVGSSLKKLAFVVLGTGILQMILQGVSSLVLLSAFDLTKLFSGQAVSSCTVNFRFELGYILGFLLLLLLSKIFQYGADLQKPVVGERAERIGQRNVQRGDDARPAQHLGGESLHYSVYLGCF